MASEVLKNSAHTPIPDGIIITGCFVYSIPMLVSILLLFTMRKEFNQRGKRTPLLFLIAVTIVSLLRLIWLAALKNRWRKVDYLLNRAALSLLLTAFSVVLMAWLRVLSAQFGTLNATAYRVIKYLLIGVNIGMAILFAVVVGCYFDPNATDVFSEGQPLYDAYVILLAVLSLLGALGFCLFGIMLWRQVRMSIFDRNPQLAVAALKIVILTGTATLAFALRCAMLLYRPITGNKLPAWEFYFLAYFLPEVLAIGLQVGTYAVKVWRRSTVANTLDDSRGAHTPPPPYKPLIDGPGSPLRSESYRG